MDEPSVDREPIGNHTIGNLRYRAFISYSHRDSEIAHWLHRSIEAYRVPSRLRGSVGEFGALPDRLIPIFRDREDLPSAGELGPRIQAALTDSEALIVICSPDAARSPWANDEVLAFKRLGRAERIYCLIVDGEPGDALTECFPPALRFDLDAHGQIGTHPAEPLAADVRAGKDGKALAKLKILSGLLGVPLDTLRQREAARQQRRMLAITALALLVMLVTSFLAVQAMIARHDADRRRNQAEALVDFMLGNLTDKLQEVSRLDILEDVDKESMAYFQSLPITDVSDRALEMRAKALKKIGSVRLDQGHLAEALQSFQASAALGSHLVQAAPEDTKRQLAYAETLAFIGTVHWYQGELDQAQTVFEASQAVLNRGKVHAPSDATLLYQLATIDNNIGHVMEARGSLDTANTQYLNMLAVSKKLITIDSGKTDWMVDLGLAHNNLAKMALLHGDLPTAVAEYHADLDIEASLARLDPRNNAQAEKLLISQATVGRTIALMGDVDSGIAQLRLSLDQANRLRAVDPQSTSFQEDFALYATQLARLLRVNGDVAGANAMSAQSLSIFAALSKQDPANTGWQRELAEARIEQAEQLGATGQVDAAREQAQSALTILEPQLAKQVNDRATVLATVAARLLLAAVSTDADAATRLRKQALQTIQAQSSGRADPRLRALQVEALLRLGRRADAVPIWQALWRNGFHDPGFSALLRSQGFAPPQRTTTVTSAAASPAVPHRP